MKNNKMWESRFLGYKILVLNLLFAARRTEDEEEDGSSIWFHH
jgi:hypothetical protein